MGWKSSAVAKATINPCKICQRGATMPPNLGFDRWPRRPADGTPTCAHKPGRYRTPAGRIAGKKHRGCGGQNHHVQGQLSELPRMLPQLRERSRNFGNVPEVSPRALRDFPMDATDPPRFREVRPWGNFGNLAFFACMRQRTPVGFMGSTVPNVASGGNIST